MENTMNQKYIDYIRDKIKNSDPYFEDFYTLTDETIERTMSTTFFFLEKWAKKCYWCKHYKRIGFSQCKIHDPLQTDCFDHDLDKHKLMKKNYDNTTLLALESSLRKGDGINFNIPRDIKKKIIIESINLFEYIEIESRLNELQNENEI